MNDKKSANATARVKASVTEAIGKLTGDKAVEEKGAAQKSEADSQTATRAFKANAKKA